MRAHSSISIASVLFGLALCLPAGVAAQTNQLIVIGGTGEAGERIPVELRLSGPDADAAVGASIDIIFPSDLLTPTLPVIEGCAVDERLAATHQVGGSLVQPGTLNLEVFARQTQNVPLGAGTLVVCEFAIAPTAPTAAAALIIDFVGLNDARGLDLPVDGVPGTITIGTVPACPGDCDGNGEVTIAELVLGSRIALGEAAVEACVAMDGNGNGGVEIAELINAVNRALLGCVPLS